MIILKLILGKQGVGLWTGIRRIGIETGNLLKRWATVNVSKINFCFRFSQLYLASHAGHIWYMPCYYIYSYISLIDIVPQTCMNIYIYTVNITDFDRAQSVWSPLCRAQVKFQSWANSCENFWCMKWHWGGQVVIRASPANHHFIIAPCSSITAPWDVWYPWQRIILPPPQSLNCGVGLWRHLRADGLENVGASTSHNPIGLHGLLQG
jgi:hypothetical protein